MLSGTMTSRTSGSGQCRIPIVTKVTIAISGVIAPQFLKGSLNWLANSGRAILATVASINPAAAAATPASMRRNAPTIVIRIIGGPSRGGDRAQRPAHSRAENHREIDHVATGQKGAQREGLVELFSGEPAPPLHHHPPRPGQNAAKSG